MLVTPILIAACTDTTAPTVATVAGSYVAISYDGGLPGFAAIPIGNGCSTVLYNGSLELDASGIFTLTVNRGITCPGPTLQPTDPGLYLTGSFTITGGKVILSPTGAPVASLSARVSGTHLVLTLPVYAYTASSPTVVAEFGPGASSWGPSMPRQDTNVIVPPRPVPLVRPAP